MRKQDWVFPLFSPDSDDRLSQNFHRFVVLYRSCDTRSVGLGQYCLPKVSNCLKLKLHLVIRQLFQNNWQRLKKNSGSELGPV